MITRIDRLRLRSRGLFKILLKLKLQTWLGGTNQAQLKFFKKNCCAFFLWKEFYKTYQNIMSWIKHDFAWSLFRKFVWNVIFCLFHLLTAFNIFWMYSNILDHAQIWKCLRYNLTFDHAQKNLTVFKKY